MNWTYLGIAALLPLTIALAAALLAGAVQAIRSNRAGGSSRVAFHRLLRTLALVFPLAFLLAALWDGHRVWRGLAGAALGRPADQRVLGQLRASGRHFLRKDPAKAALWFQKAAEGGDAEAQLFLARTLLNGQGLPRNPEGALRWAKAAANQGLPDAMVLSGDLLRPDDAEAARSWYQRALTGYRQRIQSGDADACQSYGLMYTTGKGVEKDPIEGVAWMLVGQRLGMDPFKVVILKLSEGPLSKPQREEAAQRAAAIQKTLPPKGRS